MAKLIVNDGTHLVTAHQPRCDCSGCGGGTANRLDAGPPIDWDMEPSINRDPGQDAAALMDSGDALEATLNGSSNSSLGGMSIEEMMDENFWHNIANAAGEAGRTADAATSQANRSGRPDDHLAAAAAHMSAAAAHKAAGNSAEAASHASLAKQHQTSAAGALGDRTEEDWPRQLTDNSEEGRYAALMDASGM
jgi:hypothetical protein